MEKSSCPFEPLLIGRYQIFAGLSETEIAEFCRVMMLIDFEQDQVIIQEGDVGNSILLLIEGQVEIVQALTLKTSITQLDTREKSLIKLSSDNFPFFGEMSLFSEDDRRTATVKASTVCKVGRIEKRDFFTICNQHPEIGNRVMQNIARVMSQRLRQANQNILKLTTAFSLIIES